MQSDHVRLVLPVPRPEVTAVSGDLPGVAFRPARFFRRGRHGSSGLLLARALWVVAHTAECSETAGAAEGLEAYAATMPDGRVASWTYAVDVNSTTQSVLEADTAFHAPPVNDFSVGVEMAGRAAQVESQWDDAYSQSMIMGQAAPLFAGICHRHSLPVQTIADDLLLEALPAVTALSKDHEASAVDDNWSALRERYGGILTHAQVSRVFHKSTHVDPGPHFPLDAFLAAVEAELASLG